MGKRSNHVLGVLMAAAVSAAACTKKDLVINYGPGDSVRLVDGADNFDCGDPRYASVKKVQTWTLQFADGTTRYLCSAEQEGAR